MHARLKHHLAFLQAQQRRHQNLERELRPVEEQMQALRALAARVAEDNPALASEIERKLAELTRLWQELNARALQRRQTLEDGRGAQMFAAAAAELRAWIATTQESLSDTRRPVDVADAERQLERHYELKDELKRKKDEFAYVHELGERLLRKTPNLTDVKAQLLQLHQDQARLEQMWTQKEMALKEALELQLYTREADHIDAATKAHEAFLDLEQLPVGLKLFKLKYFFTGRRRLGRHTAQAPRAVRGETGGAERARQGVRGAGADACDRRSFPIGRN